MKKVLACCLGVLASSTIAYAAHGQTAAIAASPPFEAGMPLGVATEGKFAPISPNVKVYGAVVSAESCSYDATRDLIMVVNRGANQDVRIRWMRRNRCLHMGEFTVQAHLHVRSDQDNGRRRGGRPCRESEQPRQPKGYGQHAGGE